MSKYLWILCVLCLNLSYAEMKCSEGKCSASNKEAKPKIEKKEKIKEEKKELKQKVHKRSITQLFNVQTIQVKALKASKSQSNYGYILADDARKVDVVAWYAGFVQKLYANRLYNYVKKGDALAEVYSPEVYQAKQDYLNSLNYSTAHIAAGMLQSAKTKLALLGVANKEILAIKKTRKADEFTTIYAPSSGWIFEKNIYQGSAFSQNKKLFQIVNLDKVWLEAKLFAPQLKSLKDYQDFTVSIEGIVKSFKAKKTLIYPRLDPKEATFTLRLEVDNLQGLLKEGMYAKVTSHTQDTVHIVIPRTAVIRKGGKWYAFLSTEFKGEYEPVEIQVNPLNQNQYEVLKGLTTDDTVVTNALFMMDSDAQINAIY